MWSIHTCTSFIFCNFQCYVPHMNEQCKPHVFLAYIALTCMFMHPRKNILAYMKCIIYFQFSTLFGMLATSKWRFQSICYILLGYPYACKHDYHCTCVRLLTSGTLWLRSQNAWFDKVMLRIVPFWVIVFQPQLP